MTLLLQVRSKMRSSDLLRAGAKADEVDTGVGPVMCMGFFGRGSLWHALSGQGVGAVRVQAEMSGLVIG